MNWGDLLGPLAKIGLPTLGTVIAGPAGAKVGQVLADALGTESTPEAVGAAVEADPDGATQKLDTSDVWARIAEAQASVALEQVKQTNQALREETAAIAARPDMWWSAWRTQLAQMLVIECPVWVATIVLCLWFGRVADLLQLSGLITTWWTARFGVLGVHLWTGSHERRAVITGESGGILKTVVDAVVQRKK